MTSTAQATAAPIMRNFLGKEYTLTPLKDKDYGEFENFIQDRVMDVARRNVAGLSEKDRKELLAHAFDKASSLTLSSPDALRHMESVPGVTKLLFLSLRHAHPEITEDEVGALITDPSVLESAMQALEVFTPRVPTEKKAHLHQRKVKRKKRVKPT